MDYYGKFSLDGDSILFVGDCHFNSSTPKSRIDDYATTTLEKLDKLYQLCLCRGDKLVIFLGDIFHKTQQPFSYISSLIDEFRKFRSSNILCFSISGN